jgi:hypothetical protein
LYIYEKQAVLDKTTEILKNTIFRRKRQNHENHENGMKNVQNSHFVKSIIITFLVLQIIVKIPLIHVYHNYVTIGAKIGLMMKLSNLNKGL